MLPHDVPMHGVADCSSSAGHVLGGGQQSSHVTPNRLATAVTRREYTATPSTFSPPGVLPYISLASPLSVSRSSKKLKTPCGKGVFRGLKFLLTGLENTGAFSVESISKRICAHGGTLLETEDELYCSRSRKKHSNTYLIAAPLAFRRPKFLMALSVDIPILHPQWVLDWTPSSSPSPPPPSLDQYMLAAGSSPLHPYFVFRDNTVAEVGIIKSFLCQI